MRSVFGKDPRWSATFSDDYSRRYSLTRPIDLDARDLENGRVLASCGLNPSVADAFYNDSTVRKELGFGIRWGCVRYVKVNAYPWRETKPNLMWAAQRSGHDIEDTAHNDSAIVQALEDCRRTGGIPLAAWGTHCTKERELSLWKIAEFVGIQWVCLGVNLDGSPKHSLYPPYSTPLVPWSPR